MSAPLFQHPLSVPARPLQHHGRRRSRSIRRAISPAHYSSHPIVDLPRLLSSGTLDLDHRTFPSLFRACRDNGATGEGRQLHAQAVKGDFASDSSVQRSLVRMYARFLACDDALKVFVRCPHPWDVISCNDLIVALCRTGDLVSAREVFDEMTVRNVVSWSAMVDGYARNGQLELAQELFDGMPERNQFSWNSLISGYMRFGHVEVARGIFDGMRTQWGVVTWTTMISGYVQNSQHKEALNLFFEMQAAGVVPNEVTIVSVLPAIAELGALSHGQWIHAYVDSMGIEINSVLGSALVDMYSNCGCIDDAVGVFEKLKQKNLSAWNSIISGLAAHGRGRDAIHLFYRMQKDFGIIPNEVTFTAVLSACAHSGLVEEGRRIFRLLTGHSKSKPNIRHYGCMVDLLARAGQLKDAVDFIDGMPVNPNPIIWKSLICACRIHKNAELVERVCQKIIESSPRDSGSYILVSNILNGVGRAENAGKVRRQMNDLGVKKVAGRSWIELDGVTHEFLMGRESFHPRSMEIGSVLSQMQELMNLEEYNLDSMDQLNSKEDDL